jgi:membrane protein required for beta-lactamase induction
MDDAYDTTLRQRFALAESVAADESFVAAFRLQRARQARRSRLLRRCFIGLLLLSVMWAVRLLMPWLDRVLHEADVLLARILQGPYSLNAMALVMAMLGAVVLGLWAWRQALQKD